MKATFIGHRNINANEALLAKIKQTSLNLIQSGVDTFLFGSRSEFNRICLDVITELKITYPNITRVYIRAEYPNIDKDYENYLLESYDQSIYPEKLEKAGRSVYIERNQLMIEQADYCVFYFDENYLPAKRKQSKRSLSEYQPNSGTALAYAYAKQKKKQIINLYR